MLENGSTVRTGVLSRVSTLAAACILTVPFPSDGLAGDATVPADVLRFDEFVTWRVDIDNDIVFSSDDQFSNGLSLERYGAASRDWTQARGTPAFGKHVARWFLPEREDDLLYREGWILGQDLQTPRDLLQKTLIVDDVPYAALLAVQNSWIGFNDQRLRGFGWLAGVVGPLALGEEVQVPVHRALELNEPMGWDNQLGNEPVLNIYYVRKQKLWSAPWMDVAAGIGAQAGTLLTGADVEIETRLGWNMPGGFVYIPDPTGRSLAYDAHLRPPRPTRHVVYGSVVLRAAGVARNLFLDGNTFRDSHSVDRKAVVGEFIAGLHYQRRRWGVHAHVWLSTDTVEPGAVTSATDTRNRFGSVMLEYRY